jgi:hypothetical protein
MLNNVGSTLKKNSLNPHYVYSILNRINKSSNWLSKIDGITLLLLSSSYINKIIDQ